MTTAKPSSSHDTQLWRRATSGDEAARSEIGERAHAVALAELRRRHVRGDLREELAQDSALAVLRVLDRGEEAPRDLAAFLGYRAWGVLSDWRKRMRLRSGTLDVDVLAPQLAAGSRPSERLLREEVLEAFEDCRQRLAADDRSLIDGRYGTRASVGELAALRGVHRNTLQVHVVRVLAALRRCLEAKGFTAEDLP